MGDQKYFFNPQTLTFEKQDKRFKKLLLRLLMFFTSTAILAAGFAFFYIENYDTPDEKTQKAEIENLTNHIKSYETKFHHIEAVLDEIQVRDDDIYRVILKSDPIPKSVRKAGFGGSDKYAELNAMDKEALLASTSKRLDIISKQAFIQANSYKDLLSKALEKEDELASIPAIMPISNKTLKYTSSGFGMRFHPVYKTNRFHYGMDFAAQTGTNIYATGDGIVKMVRYSRIGHGKHVVVDHGYGYETLYGHMDQFNVTVGQKVKRGQIIGFVGSTGTSTAPHLHYEVHKNGKKVNPVNYYFNDLSTDEYERIIAISNNIGQSFD